MFNTDYEAIQVNAFSVLESYQEDIDMLMEMDIISEGYTDDSFLEAEEIQSINEAVFAKIMEKVKTFVSNAISRIKSFSAAQLERAKRLIAKGKAKFSHESEGVLGLGTTIDYFSESENEVEAKNVTTLFQKAMNEVKGALNKCKEYSIKGAKWVANKTVSLRDIIFKACPTLKKFIVKHFSKTSANEEELFFVEGIGDKVSGAIDKAKEVGKNVANTISGGGSALLGKIKGMLGSIESSATKSLEFIKSKCGSFKDESSKFAHKYYTLIANMITTAASKAQRMVVNTIARVKK